MMPPERNIERLLRACAKKRRAEPGASPALHPATRRLLHSEVARRGIKPPREGFFLLRFLGDCRPGLALALSVMVVIALGGALLLPGLSKAKSKAASLNAMNNLRQIGAAAQTFAEDNSNRLPASLKEMQSYLGSTNVLVDPVSRKPFVYIGAGKQRQTIPPDALLAYSPENGKERIVLFADGSVRSVTEKKFADYGAAAASSAERGLNAQDFVQVYLPAGSLSDDKPKSDSLQKAAPLLASFQLRQNGNEIQIVDEDGSIYQGSIQVAEVADRDRSDMVKKPAASPTPPLQSRTTVEMKAPGPINRDYFFRVSGTNRLLKQTVVFTGELTLGNGLPVGQEAHSATGLLLPLGNTSINGTAVTGDGRKIQVRAQPVSR